jgi:HEAT repeats
MTLRLFFNGIVLLLGASVIAVFAGLIVIIRPARIAEYLGPNRYLFDYIQTSRKKSIFLNSGSEQNFARGALNQERSTAIPYMISLLNNFDSEIRLDALHGLHGLLLNDAICQRSSGRFIDAVPSITQFLNDYDKKSRLTAIALVGTIQRDAKVARVDLAQLLNDPDPEIRQAAAKSIASFAVSVPAYCKERNQ